MAWNIGAYQNNGWDIGAAQDAGSVLNPSGAGAVVLSALEADGAGENAAPVFSGSGAITMGAMEASGAGSSTPPISAGNGSVDLPSITASGSGASISPLFTGSGMVNLPSVVAAGTGKSSDSCFGAGAIDFPSVIVSGSGISEPPSFFGNGAITFSVVIASGNGSSTPPSFTSNGSVTLGMMTASGSGKADRPVFTGSGSIELPKMLAYGTDHPQGDRSGSGAITFAAVIVSGTGSATQMQVFKFMIRMEDALFDWLQPIAGLWQEARDTAATPRTAGKPIMVWHMQDAPRPATPILEGRISSIVKIGHDAVSPPDHFGNVKVSGTREFMLYLQYFGDSAMEVMTEIRDACEDPEHLAGLFAEGITPVEASVPIDAHEFLDTMPEDRALLDIRFRTTTEWTSSSGMPVENVQAEGRLVTGDFGDTCEIDVSTT